MSKWLLWLITKVIGNPRNGEFWAGTVNLVVQFVLRYLPAGLGNENITAISQKIADILLLVLPYAAGRTLSKIVKGRAEPVVGTKTPKEGPMPSPATLPTTK